jgi:uncharacterized protein (UPF0332 family)
MRTNLGDLLRNKMVAKVASSREQVETVIKVAERDLKAAKDNLANGYADWALNIGYNAMLQAARALMLSRGYRPVGEAKHVAVIEFVKSEYSNQVPSQALYVFSKTRKKRHKAVYEEADIVSESEARTVINNAEKFVRAAKIILKI